MSYVIESAYLQEDDQDEDLEEWLNEKEPDEEARLVNVQLVGAPSHIVAFWEVDE